MFAVIYRAWVLPGKEAQYQALWQTIANYFVAERGAIGSCLHQTSAGYYLAYSRWPNKTTRDASWPGRNSDIPADMPDTIQKAMTGIWSCIDQNRTFDEITMDVIQDLL